MLYRSHSIGRLTLAALVLALAWGDSADARQLEHKSGQPQPLTSYRSRVSDSPHHGRFTLLRGVKDHPLVINLRGFHEQMYRTDPDNTLYVYPIRAYNKQARVTQDGQSIEPATGVVVVRKRKREPEEVVHIPNGHTKVFGRTLESALPFSHTEVSRNALRLSVSSDHLSISHGSPNGIGLALEDPETGAGSWLILPDRFGFA